MINRFQPSLNRLNQFVDWFIPATLVADRESHKQARMFLFSHLFGPFIGNVVPAAIYALDPDPTFDVYVLAVSITAFWIFPFALRSFGRYNLMVMLSVQNLIFCILWSCYFYGGVTSPTLSWVLTIPLLAFFYIGPHSPLRLAVLGLFILNFFAFAALYFFDPFDGKILPLAAMQGLGLVSTSCTALYVMMMAIYYAKILASGAELETEMKQHLTTAIELRRATEVAERAGAAKAEFLAKMSHELRTPLNAVIGYSKLMLEDATESEEREAVADLERIHAAGRQLLKLINEILDLSKIEAGKMELFIEAIEIGALVQQVAADFRENAAKSGNTIVLDLSDAPGMIECDAQRVEQVLAHLLDNAIKFTRNGEITVTVLRKRGGSGDDVMISIRDTGVGIAAHKIPALFEKFTVADDVSSSKYGGTGLGLALSQQLCWLMGGNILAQSSLGAGSCFTVQLPAIAPSEGSQAHPNTSITVNDAVPCAA